MLAAGSFSLARPRPPPLRPARGSGRAPPRGGGALALRAASSPPEGGSAGAGEEDRPKWRKRYRRVLPFEEARKCAQATGFKTEEEWEQWVRDGKRGPYLGPYVPSEPQKMYADDWTSWDDWLGVPLQFNEARSIVRAMALPSQEEWWAYKSGPGRRNRIPAKPHLYYADEWKGYDDWLGIESEPLYAPKEWGEEQGEDEGGEGGEQGGGGQGKKP